MIKTVGDNTFEFIGNRSGGMDVKLNGKRAGEILKHNATGDGRTVWQYRAKGAGGNFGDPFPSVSACIQSLVSDD